MSFFFLDKFVVINKDFALNLSRKLERAPI